MLDKLFCWLGFHDYRVLHEREWLYDDSEEFVCLDCGRIEKIHVCDGPCCED